MDIESLCDLYHTNPLYKRGIEKLISEKPKILLSFVLHPVHKIPTVSSLRCLIKMAGVLGVPEVSDVIIDKFESTFESIWFPKQGITNKVVEVIDILDANDSVEDDTIWEHIHTSAEELIEYVCRLRNP